MPNVEVARRWSWGRLLTTLLTDAQDDAHRRPPAQDGAADGHRSRRRTFNAIGGLKSVGEAGPLGAAFGVHSVATSNMDPIEATAVQGSRTMLHVGWWKSFGDLYLRYGGHVVARSAPNSPRTRCRCLSDWINDRASAHDGNDDLKPVAVLDRHVDAAPVSGVFGFAQETKAQATGYEPGTGDGAFFITPKWGLFNDPATGFKLSFPASVDRPHEADLSALAGLVDAALAPYGAEHLGLFESGDIDLFNG